MWSRHKEAGGERGRGSFPRWVMTFEVFLSGFKAKWLIRLPFYHYTPPDPSRRQGSMSGHDGDEQEQIRGGCVCSHLLTIYRIVRERPLYP
jgi:hypothetical protein